MRTEKVTFYSEGDKLSGAIYLPDGEKGKPWPAIVQGPGFLGLKDAKHYILMFEKLCEAGYACLCFDYRGWGGRDRRRQCGLRRGHRCARQMLRLLSRREQRPGLAPFNASRV